MFAYCFLRNIREGQSSLNDADDEKGNSAAKIKNLDKGKKKTTEKELFKNNLGLLFSARENVLNNFKRKLFPIKNLGKIPTCESKPEVITKLTPEIATEKAKHKKTKLKLQQKFMNQIIDDRKNVNGEIFWNYFKFQNPSVLELHNLKMSNY